jgi:hypothetical protein
MAGAVTKQQPSLGESQALLEPSREAIRTPRRGRSDRARRTSRSERLLAEAALDPGAM